MLKSERKVMHVELKVKCNNTRFNLCTLDFTQRALDKQEEA